MDYRDKLKHLRIYHELEQKDVAKVCGVTPQAVSMWETKRNHIPADSLVKLCRFYQISCNSLLGLPEYPPIPPLW